MRTYSGVLLLKNEKEGTKWTHTLHTHPCERSDDSAGACVTVAAKCACSADPLHAADDSNRNDQRPDRRANKVQPNAIICLRAFYRKTLICSEKCLQLSNYVLVLCH